VRLPVPIARRDEGFQRCLRWRFRACTMMVMKTANVLSEIRAKCYGVVFFIVMTPPS
jgi:hypothetical protein